LPQLSRAAFIITNIAARPAFSSPTSHPVAPSKCITQVALPWTPILCSIEPHVAGLRLPSGSTLGTTNSEIPREPSGAPGSLASTRWTMLSVRSCSPPEQKIFSPVIA